MDREKYAQNFIAKMHPGAFFWLITSLSVLILMLAPTIYLKFLILPVFYIIALIGEKGQVFLVSLQRIAFLCFIVFIIQGTAFGDRVVFEFWFFKFKDVGIQRSLYFMLMFSTFGGALVLYFTVINLYDLCYTMRQSGVPFTAAYIFLLTLQTIPLLAKKSQMIMEAQKARGIEIEGNLITRIKAYVPMFGPLLLSSIFSTEERAITLEARAFTAKCAKTSLFDVTKKRSDILVEGVGIALSIGVIAYKAVSIWLVSL